MSRRGTVVRASPATFAGLEKAARRQNAKGVYIERGPHSKASQIQTWLNGQEEEDLMFGEFASAQLLVAPPPCEDSIATTTTESSRTEEDVEAALDQLVSELPASFRTHVRDDARRSCACRGGSPATPWITLLARGSVLAVAPGRLLRADARVLRRARDLAADDAQVDWDAFEASMGEEDNEHVVTACVEINQ